MPEIVLHRVTEAQLDSFVAAPSHALLLTGPIGSGKGSVAELVIRRLIPEVPANLDEYPFLLNIQSEDGKAIGIESIRQLDHFLRLKVPSAAKIQRAIIVADAHLMTIEAQNALLKTLEEPPNGTLFVLTATRPEALLPTVGSRVTNITVVRPTVAQLKTHFAQGFDPAVIKQAVLVSGGLPGLMAALLTSSDHPLKEATERARTLLSQSQFERLSSVDELSKNRPLSISVCYILQQMAAVQIRSAAASSGKRWLHIMEQAAKVQALLEQSAQPKLALTHLMLEL